MRWKPAAETAEPAKSEKTDLGNRITEGQLPSVSHTDQKVRNTMTDRGLLAVSFGTSVPEAEAAIINTEKALKAAFSDRIFARAFTSRIICRKLEKEGRAVDSPEMAMERLLGQGVRDLLIQPTHLTPGEEFDKLCRIAEDFRGRFETIHIGRPLISADRDLLAVTDAVLRHYPKGRDEALLLMGHGSEHFANMIYPAMQTAFRLKGAENVFVGTVEGWPVFEDCLVQLKAFRPSRVELAPLMLVAGDHALNDMAGPEEDSWRSRLTADGFTVACRTEGIGMWDEICGIYVDHARAALDG